MSRMFVALVALLCIFGPANAQAQDSRLPVSVNHSGDDTVGQRLAFALREAVRGSNGYRLTQMSDSIFRISLITLDPERAPSSTGYWTAAAVSYTMRNHLPLEKGEPQTWYPIHLSTSVLIAGTSRVDEQAKAILAGLDAQVEEYKKGFQPR